MLKVWLTLSSQATSPLHLCRRRFMKCVKPAVSGEAKTQESTTTWHIRWLKEKPVMGRKLGMFGWKMVKRFLRMHVGASYEMALSRTNSERLASRICSTTSFYRFILKLWSLGTSSSWKLRMLRIHGSARQMGALSSKRSPHSERRYGSDSGTKTKPPKIWARTSVMAFLNRWTACFLCFLHAASVCRNFDTISLHTLQLRPSPAKLLSMLEVEVDACAPVAWANPNATSIDEFHHLSAPSLKIWWVGGDR